MSKICSAADCGKSAVRRGWCPGHYRRWRIYGDPMAGGTHHGAPLAFIQTTIADPTDSCVIWPYSLASGYGVIFWQGKNTGAHRLALALHQGVSLPETHVDTRHSCHNRSCINPRHLSWGSRKDNIQDAIAANRFSRGESHYNSKLTENDVRNIRVATGTHDVIADEYRITRSVVTMIKNHRKWAWLD